VTEAEPLSDALRRRLAALTPEQRDRLEDQIGAPQPGPASTPVSVAGDHEPFPMTDIQQAYWAGRSADFGFGGVATHSYHEIDAAGLDLGRLAAAWNRLVERHDMLRAVFTADGSQRILPETPLYDIAVDDLRGLAAHDSDARLAGVRRRMSHQVLPSDRWPIFEIRASLLDDGRTRLHLSFDAIVADLSSRRILMREWSALYSDPTLTPTPPAASFRDFVLAERAQRSSDSYLRARDYWLARIDDLAPPRLPLLDSDAAAAPSVFTRRRRRLDSSQREALEQLARGMGVTLNVLLLTAYADVLRFWSDAERFTLNLTLFNRPPGDAAMQQVVGDFTALTMLEVEAPGDLTLLERAAALQAQLWRDLDHRQFSGVQMLREIARRRGGAGPAMMPFVFTSALGAQEAGDLEWIGREVYAVSQTPQVWLDLMVVGHGDGLAMHWNAVDGVFPPGMMADLFQAFGRLLDGLLGGALDSGSSWRAVANLLLPTEAHESQREANATDAPAPTRLLHQPWKDHAVAAPHRTAVICGERGISYGQLATATTHLGHRLRDLGVRANTLTGVVMYKGWEQVVAVLAILEAGGAYLPIDPDVPPARLAYLLADGQVDRVLTQPSLKPRLAWPAKVSVIELDESLLSPPPSPPLEVVQQADDLAYVIYTSGSSGEPKGVAIDHRGAVGTITDINARFGVGPSDRLLALSALTFDLSVYDIFGVLAAGGAIVMPGPESARDPARWARLMADHGVTLWNTAPALMELLVDYAGGAAGPAFADLRLALLSGDRIPVALPTAVRAMASNAKVVSLGGATEASIWSIWHEIGADDASRSSIPYGKPLRNQRVRVIGPGLTPRPTWATGELHIGGAGLARGYWRDEEKTAAAFITDPQTGERLYRTGDHGRYLPDGSIEFLGRVDNQIKLRGFRVELGEVEAVLARHSGVKAAVVVARGATSSQRSLAAFVTPRDASAAPAIDDLSQYLQGQLPAHMVPAAISVVRDLPLTANGKVDRARLSQMPPLPDGLALTTPAHGPDAARIGDVVRRAARIEIPGDDSSFLDLGLTSIDLIRIVNAIEAEFGFRPNVERLYASPTIRWLAENYAARGAAPEAPPAPRKAAPMLDPMEREAFKAQRHGRRDAGDGVAVPLPDAALPNALRAALLDRRSVRQFLLRPVQATQLSGLLEALRQRTEDGRYAYGSASDLYPVQTYLYAKPGRIAGVEAGAYYYDPSAHCLRALESGKALSRSAFSPLQNAPIFDDAAFALFLVAEMGAIEPVYADRSLHLATLEAGMMTQTLAMIAPACDLGLCQIGSVETDAIGAAFQLSGSHRVLHALFGGCPDTQQPEARQVAQPEQRRLERLLQQVEALSPDETRALLEAYPGARG
jgi:amino acid adenylation domain-containing protein